jgi:hypothetical protein
MPQEEVFRTFASIQLDLTLGSMRAGLPNLQSLTSLAKLSSLSIMLSTATLDGADAST